MPPYEIYDAINDYQKDEDDKVAVVDKKEGSKDDSAELVALRQLQELLW